MFHSVQLNVWSLSLPLHIQKLNTCPEACYHIFSQYIIPFCGWLLMCHTVKKKNSFSTGTILLLWHFPNTAPATKHPSDACRSEWLHFHLPCHWGRTSSPPQQREAERTTHFSDSDMHGLIFACEQPQVRLFINYIHHLSRPSVHYQADQQELLTPLPHPLPKLTREILLLLHFSSGLTEVWPQVFTETACLSLPQVDHGCSVPPDDFTGTQNCKPQKTAGVQSHADRISCCCHAEMISYNFKR